MKKKPQGFKAVCQCGKTTGALDLPATGNKEAGAILGKWLQDGCTVYPIFEGSFSVSIEVCTCEKSPPETEKNS